MKKIFAASVAEPLQLNRVHYVDTSAKAQHALGILFHREGYVPIGFDTEWGDDPTKGCSIVQIATQSDVFIFDTLKSADARDAVKSIFESPQFVKIGFSLHNDWIFLNSPVCARLVCVLTCSLLLAQRFTAGETTYR